MKNHIKLILILMVALVGATQQYKQNVNIPTADVKPRRLLINPAKLTGVTRQTRTSNVQNYCKKPRDELVSNQEITTANSYFDILNIYFNTDPILLAKSVINLDYASIASKNQNVLVGLGIYIAPFAIGFILSLSIWTCLCCCCICPGRYSLKCCRKYQGKPYTKCQLLWPVIFLMIVLLLACAASFPGIIKASSLNNSITNVQCGISLSLDDLLNGNVSSDNQTFFIGTYNFVTALGNLKINFSNIVSNFSTLQADIASVQANCNSAKNSLQILSDGSTTNATFSLNYTTPTPLNSAPVASNFGAVLGVPSDNTTLTGSIYAIVTSLLDAMNIMSNTIATLNSTTATTQFNIQLAADGIANYSTIISNLDTSLSITFNTIAPYLKYLRVIFVVYYGTVMGMSFIALIGVIMMAFLYKPYGRNIMYGSCVIIVVITILGFLLSSLLSFTIPILYMGCSVINPALSSNVGFLNITSALNLPYNITSIASVCLPGGGGNILNTFGTAGAAVNNTIDDVQTMMTLIKSYGNYNTTLLTDSANNINNVITEFEEAKRNDIALDTISLSWFEAIANRTRPSSCLTDIQFMTDSLVPSTDPLSRAIIPYASGTTVDFCTTLSSCGTAACINMFTIMSNALNLAIVQSQLTARYPGSCGTSLSAEFATNYNNWHMRRVSSTDGITSVKNRWQAGAFNNISNIATGLGIVSPQMINTFNILNSSVSSLVDPIYGMAAGTNCMLIGEDLVITKNTICVSLFNSLYYLFITIGTTSFALLFSVCCIVCSGVRYSKQFIQIKRMRIPDDNQISMTQIGIGATFNTKQTQQ